MPKQSHAPLSKEQKVGFTLLLIFCMLVLGMGGLQIRNTLYKPFVYTPPEKPALTQADIEQREILRLQAIDTDQDGLNDYEEMTFYQTSRYLPDTDSDGLKDKEELDGGKNPLCPEGKECAEDPTAELAQGENDLSDGLQLANPQPTQPVDILSFMSGQQAIAPGTSIAPDVEAFLQDPDKIREFIAQTGKISKEDLDKIPDEKILEIVQGIAEKQGQLVPGMTSSSSTDTGQEDETTDTSL